jgi:hypothetical protein
MLVEDWRPIPNGEVLPGGPPYRSVTLYSQACACERSRKASPPRGVTIVAAYYFHLILHSLRCQRESER